MPWSHLIWGGLVWLSRPILWLHFWVLVTLTLSRFLCGVWYYSQLAWQLLYFNKVVFHCPFSLFKSCRYDNVRERCGWWGFSTPLFEQVRCWIWWKDFPNGKNQGYPGNPSQETMVCNWPSWRHSWESPCSREALERRIGQETGESHVLIEEQANY